MDKKHRKSEGKRQKKGVTATPDDIRGASTSQGQVDRNIPEKDGIEAVKDELRTVIDSMGPSTPNLSRTTAGGADNEESSYPTSTLSFSISITQEEPGHLMTSMVEESETVGDISEMSTLLSDPVDAGVCDECTCEKSRLCMFNKWDLQRHLETCPCRQYARNIQRLMSPRRHDRSVQYQELLRQPVATSLNMVNTRDIPHKFESLVQQPATTGSNVTEQSNTSGTHQGSSLYPKSSMDPRSTLSIQREVRHQTTTTRSIMVDADVQRDFNPIITEFMSPNTVPSTRPDSSGYPTITGSIGRRPHSPSSVQQDFSQNLIVTPRPSRRIEQKMQSRQKSWNLSHIFSPTSILNGQNEPDNQRRSSKEKAMQVLSSILKIKRPNLTKEPLELYKINIASADADNSPPKKIVFELIEDLPRPDMSTVATNTAKGRPTRRSGVQVNTLSISYDDMMLNQQANSTLPKDTGIDDKNFQQQNYSQSAKLPNDQPTKVDVYYFDHGNASYYRTTDCAPILITETIAEKTEHYTMKFWAQFYGTIHIGFAFFTSFVLQTLRFLFQSLIRPLSVGVLQLSSDYFFKPFLAVLFNALLQPILIFLYNIGTSVRDCLDPIAEGLGYFLREIANVFRAMRLIEVKNTCDGQAFNVK